MLVKAFAQGIACIEYAEKVLKVPLTLLALTLA